MTEKLYIDSLIKKARKNGFDVIAKSDWLKENKLEYKKMCSEGRRTAVLNNVKQGIEMVEESNRQIVLQDILSLFMIDINTLKNMAEKKCED